MTRSRIGTALVITAASLGLMLAVLLLVGIAQHGRILPGTSVAGVDVGGQDVASARRILGPALAAEQRHPVAVSRPGALTVLDPRDVGLTVDVDATVDAAFARGRSGPLGGASARLLAPVRDVDVAPRRALDEARLAAWVDDLADRIDRESSEGSIEVTSEDGSYAVTSEPPRGALRVDRAASVSTLRDALLGGERRARIVASVELPPSGAAAIERLAGDIEHAVRRPLLLRDDGRTLIITPDVLVELIDLGSATDEHGRSSPTLDVPVSRVRDRLGSEGRETFDRPGREARILTDRTPPATLSDLGDTTFRPVETSVTIVPSESRTRFVPALTAAQIERMIATRQHAAVADLDAEEPDITTADVLGRRPTHLLGTFTTSYPAGPPRTVNIALLADILDDRPIAPGATFSINETSGPRRCEDGFVPAGTIIRGELVDTCGGGVSQVGTTVMNAAFFAGVDLEEWQPHSFYISRYPAGREATLSYPDIDVRFTNDTDDWMVLRASTTPDSVTVSLYGVPHWQEVRAAHGDRRAPTDFGRVERPTSDLAPGARRVVQSGSGGFTISVTRTRVAIDGAADATTEDATTGDVTEQRWTTVYLPQLRIVEIGVAPGAAPDPTRDPGTQDSAADG